jgi:hypothetical protein
MWERDAGICTSQLDARETKAAGDTTRSSTNGPHPPSLRCRRRHTSWSLLKSDANTCACRPPILIPHHRLRVRKPIPRHPKTKNKKKNRIEAAKISKKKSSRGSARKSTRRCIYHPEIKRSLQETNIDEIVERKKGGREKGAAHRLRIRRQAASPSARM